MHVFVIIFTLNHTLTSPHHSLSLKMEALKENDRRGLIGRFYQTNWGKGKNFAWKHFKNMGISKSTVYYIMRRCDEGRELTRKAGFGRKAARMPPGKVNDLRRYTKNKVEYRSVKQRTNFGFRARMFKRTSKRRHHCTISAASAHLTPQQPKKPSRRSAATNFDADGAEAITEIRSRHGRPVIFALRATTWRGTRGKVTNKG